MGFVDSFKNMIGIEGTDDDMEDITEEEINKERAKMSKEYSSRNSSDVSSDSSNKSSKSPRTTVNPPMEKKFSMINTSTGTFKILITEPKAFEDCPKLVDSLKAKRPIIINLENLDNEVARKIFDFLNGATYALEGNVKKVTNNTFVFAPNGVDIMGNQEGKAGFDFDKNKSPWRQ